MLRLFLIAAWCVLLVSCNDAESSLSPTIDGAIQTPSSPCLVPDTACQDELPHPSSPCEGELTCLLSDPQGNGWEYVCRDGAWFITDRICQEAMCSSVPPLVQYCRDEFEGTVEGATVSVGPLGGSAFESFKDDDFIEIVYGTQGAPMLGFRLQIPGAETVECARVSIRASIPGEPEEGAIQRVQMHCGLSLGVYLALTWPIECESRVFPLELDIDVAGVGRKTVNLQFMGGEGCFG